jgi:hypothetical protein
MNESCDLKDAKIHGIRYDILISVVIKFGIPTFTGKKLDNIYS